MSKGENRQQKESWGFCLRSLLNVWPVLLLIIGVLGSIYAGVATPTEAAAIGCSLVLVVAAFYRLLNWEAIKRAIEGAVVTGGMVLCLYFSGRLLIVFLASGGIARHVADSVVGLGLHPLMVIAAIIIMYLVMGMLMDALSMMIMTLPITIPIITGLGFDLIWFGVIMTMLCECALLTPPVGFNLFILQGLRPEYPFAQLVRGCLPFFIVLLVVIILMIAFPHLITFLPETMMG